MKELLGSSNEVATVISRSPWFLSVNFESRVVPNVEILKSCGASMDSIRTILINEPNSFLFKPEITRKSAEKVREMGLDSSTKSFFYAILTIAQMRNEAWEFKLQALRDMGFSDSDILTMFKKSPKVILGSMENKRTIKELLLSTGKFNMISIVNYPLSLRFSIEKRIKPRLRILGILDSRELIKDWPELGMICRLSDDEFFKRFIRPYLNEIRNCLDHNDFCWGQEGDEPRLVKQS